MDPDAISRGLALIGIHTLQRATAAPGGTILLHDNAYGGAYGPQRAFQARFLADEAMEAV